MQVLMNKRFLLNPEKIWRRFVWGEPQPSEANRGLGAERPTLWWFLQFFFFFLKNNPFFGIF